MEEKYEALLTAGLILAGLGVYFLTIPAGVIFGGVLLVAGIVTFAMVLRRAIPAWRTARKERAARGERFSLLRKWDHDRLWSMERLFTNGAGVGSGFLIVGILQSIWAPEPAWTPLTIGACWLLLGGIAGIVLLLRRRRAAR